MVNMWVPGFFPWIPWFQCSKIPQIMDIHDMFFLFSHPKMGQIDTKRIEESHSHLLTHWRTIYGISLWNSPFYPFRAAKWLVVLVAKTRPFPSKVLPSNSDKRRPTKLEQGLFGTGTGFTIGQGLMIHGCILWVCIIGPDGSLVLASSSSCVWIGMWCCRWAMTSHYPSSSVSWWVDLIFSKSSRSRKKRWVHMTFEETTHILMWCFKLGLKSVFLSVEPIFDGYQSHIPQSWTHGTTN